MVLAGPLTSGVCVGCARLAQHWSGRHARGAGRSTDEWCLCGVCEVSPALELTTSTIRHIMSYSIFSATQAGESAVFDPGRRPDKPRHNITDDGRLY